jgi:hypothetical protein
MFPMIAERAETIEGCSDLTATIPFFLENGSEEPLSFVIKSIALLG